MMALTEKKQISLFQQTVQKIFAGMLKYELQPSMSVVGVEKFASIES